VIARYQGAQAGTGGTVTVGSGSAAGYTLHTFSEVGSSTFDLTGLDMNQRLGVVHNGILSGSGDLSFTGPGRLTLNAANTYTGATRVNAGTLALGSNGSIANSSSIRIENGARLDVSGREGFTVGETQTLSGGGNVSGHVSISGVHSPGFSPGLQIFEDGLSYNTGAVFVWELIGNTVEGRGINFDAVDVTGGTLAIAAGVTAELVFNLEDSAVDWTDSFWDEDRRWLVFSNAEAPELSSASIFDSLTVSADSTGTMLEDTAGRNLAFFSWLEEDGDLFLQYAAVPEPGTLVLALLLGLAALIGLRRRGVRG